MFKLPKRQKVFSILSQVTEKGIVLVVIVYVIISVGRSVMKNYHMNRRINTLKQRIVTLEQEKSYMKNLVAYYKTDTFKELRAREDLGLQKAGEHVISVPIEEEDIPEGATSHFVTNEPEAEKQLPNYEKWFQYFFGA